MRNTVTFVTPRMAPAAGKRVVAITQIAMFDAINSIERRYQPDLSQLLAAATASKEAAAAAAARIALAGLLPQVGGQVKVTMAVISWRSGTEFYRVLPRVSRCTDKIIGNDGRGGTLVSDPRSQVSRLRRAHLPVTRRCDGGRGGRDVAVPVFDLAFPLVRRQIYMILRYNDGISVTRQFNAGERSLRISLCLSLRFGEPTSGFVTFDGPFPFGKYEAV